MDFITGQFKVGQREQRSCIVSRNNFIFIDKFILFCKQCLFVILMRKKIFYQPMEKQTESAEQLQHNGNFTEATAAEIA